MTREGAGAAQAAAPTSPAGEGSEVHHPGGPSVAALPGARKKQENLGRSELSSEASNCTGRCLDTGITRHVSTTYKTIHSKTPRKQPLRK